MIGEAQFVLEEILTEKQIHHILKQSIGEDKFMQLKGSEVRPAMEGIAGFLGDHIKAVLEVDVDGETRKVHLFIKRIPTWNKPKTNFINEYNFYRREAIMFKILEEICQDDPNPWCVKAYVYTNIIFMMPDLTAQGYKHRHFLDTHVLLTTTTIGRFHAAIRTMKRRKALN